VLPPPDHGRRADLAWLAAILALTLGLFARGLGGGFVSDDRILIERNPRIDQLASIPGAFTRAYWEGLESGTPAGIGHWRPLTATLHVLLWPLARGGSAPYHAAGLLLHLAAVALAFRLARRLGADRWLAGATTLLFALHPVQVESVAWISALNDVLAGFLVLLACERFLAWRARGSRGVPLAPALLFALGLLAKETAVAALPILALLELLQHGGSVPRDVRRAHGPVAAVLALYALARMLVFASPWGGLELGGDIASGVVEGAWLRVRLLGGFLELLALPLEPDLFRPFPIEASILAPHALRATVACALLAAVCAAALRRRSRLALSALAVLVGGLSVPVAAAEALGRFPLGERFLYVPAFGFALGLALFLARALPEKGASLALAVLAALYGTRSVTRIGAWHDEETFFRRAARSSPGSVTVQCELGRVLLELSSRRQDAGALAEARQAFETAATLLESAKRAGGDEARSESFLSVNLGLAWCSIAERDWSAALLVLEEVVRRAEEIRAQERAARERGLPVREQRLDLARVHGALAVAQFRSGKDAEAALSFERSLALEPLPDTHQNRGRMFAEQGRWSEAAAEFEAALRLRPGNPEDRLLLAQAWQTMGKSAEAEALARALIDALPARPEPLIVLATAALDRRDSATALARIDDVLALEPRHAQAWYLKALALVLRDDRREALVAFRNAVELGPASFEAHYNLAAFLLAQGALAEAEPYLVRAYSLAPPERRGVLRENLLALELEEPGVLAELEATDAARGELEAALVWNERRRAQEPEEALCLGRARLLRRLGRDAEAVDAFRRCGEARPDDFELWSELGSTLHALGRREEARPALERALELDPPPGVPEATRARAKERLRSLLEGAPNPPPDGGR
jgi:tetratricopeptide (TPR) repeat protein